MNPILLYDTTLRDGSQREDISFSVEDKLSIVNRLAAFGMHYIECGWPGSNPKDAEFFARANRLNVPVRLAAFGRTRNAHKLCDDDANLQALVVAGTPAVTLVGKAWDYHVRHVLSTTSEENLAMIADSVAWMKAQGREVIFDAEHFYDGFLANSEYALATLRAAAEAGADWLVLCETNGGKLPWEMEAITREVATRLPGARIGVHCHNDTGCAVANSLAAVRSGATMVQGTINGYGERVGNADLVTILPNLQLKMGHPVLPDDRLLELTTLSRFVAEVANLKHDDHQPYTGHSAFAHKGGIHVAAILKSPDTYQHIDPERVGNVMRSVTSELSGRGNLQCRRGAWGSSSSECAWAAPYRANPSRSTTTRCDDSPTGCTTCTRAMSGTGSICARTCGARWKTACSGTTRRATFFQRSKSDWRRWSKAPCSPASTSSPMAKTYPTRSRATCDWSSCPPSTATVARMVPARPRKRRSRS